MAKGNGRKLVTPQRAMPMRANINLIRRTVMESLTGRVVIPIRETTKMMNVMATGRCTGWMAQYTKENGEGESNMV